MANEVDLVVRARNEATKAINSVRDAVKGLRDEQDDLSKSAEKSGGPLGRFVDELTRLKTEAEGIRSLGKVKDSLDAIATRADRTEKAVQKTAKALNDLEAEAQQASAKTAQFKQNVDGLKTALDRETAAFRNLRKENTAANNELTKAENKLKSLQTQQAKTPSLDLVKKIAEQQIAVANATAKQVDVSGRYDAATKARNDAAQSYRTLNAQIAASAAEERRIAAAIESTTVQHQKNQRAAGAATDQLSKAKTVGSEVAQVFGNVASSEEAMAKAAADNAAQMQRVTAAMERQKQLDARTAQVDRGRPVDLAADVNRQINVVAQARREIELVRQATIEMLNPANQAGKSARELANSFELLNVRAAQADQAFRNESEALRQLQARLQAANMERFNQSVSTSARSTRTLATETRATAQALSAGGNGAGIFKSALSGIYGEGRQALSLMQRLRGEILSLTATYVGFQATVQGLSTVIDNFRALEAAQNRLGSVFNQDTAKVAQEINFLRAQAQRLGIEFSVLSNEYSKFAVATQAAGFAQESTRRIFLAVAEAARVNKLSNEQLQGTFLALQQMASKGKVSAQELQQQLGERLPGAVTIFAKALGLTNAELIKLQEKGEVLASESNLLKFADELNRRFGPQLESSLKSTSAEIGRFQNSLFSASLQVAAGGFIASFTDLLRTMNEFFASQQGVQFFTALGAALGRITDGVKIVLQNFELLKVAIAALISLKITGFIASLVGGLRQAQVAAQAATGAQTAFAAETAIAQGVVGGFVGGLRNLALSYRLTAVAMQATANTSRIAIAGMTAMQMALGGLRGALGLAATGFRLLWGAVGGLPGLVITGVTLALGQWLTQVNSATAAIEEHKRILAAVNAAYEDVKGTTREWADAIKGATLSQALANAQKLRAEYNAAVESARGLAMVQKAGTSDLMANDPRRQQAEQLVKLFDDLAAGATDLDKVTQALDKIALTGADDQIKETALELLGMINTAKDGEHSIQELWQAVNEADATVRVFNKTVSETDKVLLGAEASAAKSEEALKSATEQGAKKFNEAMLELQKSIPGMADELKKLESINALQKQYEQALRFARSIGQVKQAWDAFQNGVTAINTPTLTGDTMQATIQLLKDREGFQPTGKWDRNAFRAGYGSDTVTLSDGTIQKVTEGMAVTRAEADADLVRRIGEFQTTVKNQIGEDRFNSFNPQQQAVLTSLAYNYGDLASTGKLSTFREGSVSEIVAAIEDLKSHNDGINATRRQMEANIFGGGATPAAADAEQLARSAEAEQKKAAAKKEYLEDAEKSSALLKDELANNGEISREMGIQQAVQAEIDKAKKAGTIADPERLQLIRDSAAAEWDRNNALKSNKTELQQANQALALANSLSTQRNTLEAQIKTATAAGNTTVLAQAQTELAGVNTKLAEGIEKARAMWQAIGGPQADAAIAKLDALKTKTTAVQTQMSYFGLNMSQIQSLVGSFADGFANAFADFVTAVAQGENAMKALKTAFIQFAANFLREIATMILKQMILNALSGMGGPIGTAATALMKTGHTGGVVGAAGVGVGNMNKRVSPAIFAGAMKYHTGGLVGLRPDEMPIIAKRNEEMITEQDPRHRNNGGLAGMGGDKNIAIRSIVTLDPEFGRSMMQSSDGEHAVMSHIKKNRAAIKQLIR